MREYKIVEPMPQYGKDVARIVYVPDEMIKQIRTDAIDDFAKRLKAEYIKHYVDGDPYFDYIDEIAEQLKKVEIQ